MGYDAYLVALEAIKQAGSTDSAAIRDALANAQIDGVTGSISFDENGMLKDMAFIKILRTVLLNS